MKIVVYGKGTQEKQAELNARVARVHAEYVARYIEKLNCPTEQKLRLLDAVAKTVLADAQETNNI